MVYQPNEQKNSHVFLHSRLCAGSTRSQIWKQKSAAVHIGARAGEGSFSSFSPASNPTISNLPLSMGWKGIEKEIQVRGGGS